MAVTLAKHEIDELSELNLTRVSNLNDKMKACTNEAMRLYSHNIDRVRLLDMDLQALTLERLHIDNAISRYRIKSMKAG